MIKIHLRIYNEARQINIIKIIRLPSDSQKWKLWFTAKPRYDS